MKMKTEKMLRIAHRHTEINVNINWEAEGRGRDKEKYCNFLSFWLFGLLLVGETGYISCWMLIFAYIPPSQTGCVCEYEIDSTITMLAPVLRM